MHRPIWAAVSSQHHMKQFFGHEKIKKQSKGGGRKYLNQTNKKKGKKEPETWALALDKIEKDAEFDGFYGIQTSEKNLSAPEIIEAYHTLWKIEESFRIMKTTLELQPVYHSKPWRIKGHFVVCFLAFLMERKMESMLKRGVDDVISSPERIQEALNSMTLAAVVFNNEELFIKASHDPLAYKIFRLLKIQTPANISKKSELIDRLQLNSRDDSLQLSFL